MLESLLLLLAGTIVGSLSTQHLQVRAEKRARFFEAQALAAQLWAELIVYRDTNAELGAPRFYSDTLEEWRESGTLPHAEFLYKALEYEAADAYPIYWASIPRLGSLGHEIAEQIARLQTIELALKSSVRKHIEEASHLSVEQSKATAIGISRLYARFLNQQDIVIESLGRFAHEERKRFRWLWSRASPAMLGLAAPTEKQPALPDNR